MFVFVTKYALTNGILRKQVREADNGLVVTVNDRYVGYFHGEGREWHRTFEAASARAKEMRDAKLKSIAKQAAKLKSLTFTTASES